MHTKATETMHFNYKIKCDAIEYKNAMLQSIKASDQNMSLINTGIFYSQTSSFRSIFLLLYKDNFLCQPIIGDCESLECVDNTSKKISNALILHTVK